jgi:predicted AlkP superfamily phosphohydrolase/phosphomutase
MTGTQSGEHGIFGFMDLQSGTYKMYFPNFMHLKAPPLWRDMDARGMKKQIDRDLFVIVVTGTDRLTHFL